MNLDVEKLREEFKSNTQGQQVGVGAYVRWLEVELAYARAEIEIHKQHDQRVCDILKSEIENREADLKGEL